ncbi:hypothetical protein CISIN_1g038943mg [Citrus sinensis]|uniref:Uncharacterized protein n=1 Tax=Citrus sinensis TaxID=2711 RepID=A0A067DN36_CITSI|nr:hypothetical protein CISIN_1g038943mg [Citrus sinensis]
MDDVQVEDLIVEVEVELENDGDNEKTTDSCDIFKRALESQSDPLPVHSHPGDKINNSREKTPGIVILVNYTSKKRSNEENVCETYELELLKNGETIPVEDLGYVMTVDMRRLLKTNHIPNTEKLKEEKREEEEENVDPRTLRIEMSDSNIEPMSMHLRCEGVENFSTKVIKNLPWKKVLEFGCHVFYPTCTPSDLKDKRRNNTAKKSLAISRR